MDNDSNEEEISEDLVPDPKFDNEISDPFPKEGVAASAPGMARYSRV